MSIISDANFQVLGDEVVLHPGQRVIKIGNRMFPIGIGNNAMPEKKMYFYKCANVYGPSEEETVVISGCPTEEVNGTYLPTEFTTNDMEGNAQIVYSNGTYYYFYGADWGTWGVGTDYSTGTQLYMGSVGGSWNDTDWMTVEGMSAANGTAIAGEYMEQAWDGYKAVLNNGVYTFEETLTSGLTYSGVKPHKYGIYNGDASIKIDWLNDGNTLSYGLVFYAPLTDDLEYAETGQALNNRNVELAEFDGKKCASFKQDSNRLFVDHCPFPAGRTAYTISVLVAPTEAEYRRYVCSLSPNGEKIYLDTDGLWHVTMIGMSDATTNMTLNTWQRLTITRDEKGISKAYLDKTEFKTGSSDGFTAPQYLCIGSWLEEGNNIFYGYMKDFRVYDRALSEAEIGQLVDKFGV